LNFQSLESLICIKGINCSCWW